LFKYKKRKKKKKFIFFKKKNKKNKKKYKDIYNFDKLQKEKTKEIQTQIQSRLDKLYLSFKPSDIEDISKPRQINDVGNAYPNWLEDLLSVSKTSLYELKEGEINIPNILEQNDKQFLETLKERVKGLEQCSKDEKEEDQLKKEYYDYEFTSESNKLIDTNSFNSFNDKKKIKEICSNIKWGTEDYNYHKTKSDDEKFAEFTKFLEEYPEEINYLKTFLPSTCFNSDSNGNVINIIDDEIINLIKSKDRKYRQYIFGFYNDVKKFIPLKQFYEIYNMQEGWKHNCNPLVNWNLILNMLNSRCSIYNDDVIFPARFILPSIATIKINNNSDKLNYDIRNPTNLKSFIFILNSKLKLKFVGFLNIKYFYENTQQFRNWILLIFKNEFESNNSTLMDYISGEISEYIIVNFKFEQVNIGSLVGKIGVTYEELKDFKLKSRLKQIFLYNFNDVNDNKTTFFIRSNILSDNDKSKYKMEDFDINYLNSNSNFDRSYFSIGGSNNNLKINPMFINIINIFNDKLSNNTYNSYLNLYLSKYVFNIKHENKFEIFRILYKYLLISSNETSYRSLIDKKTYDKYLITKYKPLHYKYYALYETLIKFNIFHNINKNDNILNIGNNLTPIEIIKNNNYKINKIKCIIFEPKIIYLKHESNSILNYIKNFKNIYDLDVIFFTEKIEKILNIDINNINNYQLFFYNIYNIDNQF